MLKLRVSITRKIGDPNYGSHGAGCDLEAELDSALLSDPDQLRAKIRQAYAICASAVAAELQEPAPARPAEPPPSRPREDDRPPARSNGYNGNGRSSGRQGGGGGTQQNGPPRNGKQFAGWISKQPRELLDEAKRLAEANNWPSYWIHLTDDEARMLHHELTAKEPAGSSRWGGG